MAIFTSRFSNPELKTGKYYTVGITLGKPRFSLGYVENDHCYALAPDKSMWGKTHEEFTRLYEGKLNRMGTAGVKRFIDSFVNRATGRDVVMLCYEDVRDPEQFCHRTTLADWLNRYVGMDIKELPDPTPVKYKKKPKPKEEETTLDQVTLF